MTWLGRGGWVAGGCGLLLAAGVIARAADGPPPPTANMKTLVGDAVKDAVKGVVGGAAAKAGVPLPAAQPTPAAATAAGIPSPPPAPSTPKIAPVVPLDPAERLVALRRKILNDQDFVENDEINRDPFRSYLRLFGEKPVVRAHTIPAIFEKFALEELTLIAIVSGDADPRAMFRDPGGFGRTVKRGDFVSKNSARITKILSDRVIFELSEIRQGGETKSTEKAVLVNPETVQP